MVNDLPSDLLAYVSTTELLVNNSFQWGAKGYLTVLKKGNYLGCVQLLKLSIVGDIL